MTMRPFISAAIVLAVVLGVGKANASILDSLVLGQTTAEDASQSFTVLSDSGTGIKRTMTCQKDEDSQVYLWFYSRKLWKYSVVLKLGSEELKELGGADAVVRSATESLGKPNHSLMDGEWRQWEVGPNFFVVDQSIEGHLHISMASKAMETRAGEKWAAPSMSVKFKFDGPHYFKGFRPEWTKHVTLFRGTYRLEARHEGNRNFIVYLEERYSHRLVVNEIGNSHAHERIIIPEDSKRIQFLVKRADGPWEIELHRLHD